MEEVKKEWEALRNLVATQYKEIVNIFSKPIYREMDKTYSSTTSRDNLSKYQQGAASNTLSIINRAIYQKFFCIKDDKCQIPNKWQNQLSCDNLTKLILLLNKSIDICEDNKGDFYRAEKIIKRINTQEFLYYKTNNEREFEKRKSFPEEEIENKDFIKKILVKYIRRNYVEFCVKNYSPDISINDYIATSFNCLADIDFNKYKTKKEEEDYTEDINNFYNQNNKEYLGLTFDGRNIYRVIENGLSRYEIEDKEVEYDELQPLLFSEEEYLDMQQ